MNKRFHPFVRSTCAVLALTALIAPALAEDSGGNTPLSRNELLRLLAERDAAIIALQNRMRDLERRVGAAAPAGRAAVTTTPVATSNGAPGATPVDGVAPATPPAAPTATAEAPASGEPGQLAIDPQAAERALERTLVARGALLLAPGQVEVEPSLQYSRVETQSSTLIVTPAGVPTGAGDRKLHRNVFDANVGMRFGLPYDAQLELDLPYRWVDQSSSIGSDRQLGNSEHGSGLGDIGVGLAKGLLREKGWLPDLIARVRWDTGSGEQNDNDTFLGGGAQGVLAQLTATKRQDPLVFLAQAGYEWNFEHNNVREGNAANFAQGVFLAASPETSLRFLFTESFSDDTEIRGDRVRGSDFVNAAFEVGAAMTIGRSTLLDLSGSVGLTEDAPDFTLRLGVPIRFNLPFF